MTREFEIVVEDGWVGWLMVCCGIALCFAAGYTFASWPVLGVALLALGVAALVVNFLGVMS